MYERARRQTAWALNFWLILNVSVSDNANEKEKNCVLIFLFMNVTIPGTPGRRRGSGKEEAIFFL
jgi:hypothetical protein